MTVMLLQRFASPHSTHSQRTNNEGVQSSAALSVSPTATSLSTPSPTPVPFLFLLESQDSWDTDLSLGNSEACAPSLPGCASGEHAGRLCAKFTVPSPVPAAAVSSATSCAPAGTNSCTGADSCAKNNSKNSSHNGHNNNNNNNNNVVILGDIGDKYEKSRKFGGQFQKDKSEVEGWIVGGASVGSGVCSVVGNARDCSGGLVAAAAGSGYGRFAGSTAAAAGDSTTPTGTAEQRTGEAVAAASAAAAAAAAAQGRIDGEGVAMRYYRLWIYACNIVLLGSALGLAAAVSRTLVFSSDPRRYLVPGVPRALDATAIYAYLALATQLGLVQLLGCIAARRLSARLLNAYWVLLLALLFGDAVIGVAWVFRFERMRSELRPTLRLRLQLDYGKEPRFSEQWDRLQRDFSCCGMSGHEDFESSDLARLPESCCPAHTIETSLNANTSETCQQPWPRGCEDALVDWLKKTADLLFVVGFCVIAFAKLCFLGILRYEIREMIQKIKLLMEPPPPPQSALMGGSTSVLCTSPPFVQSFSQLGVSPVVESILTTNTSTHINNNNNNNNSNNNNNNSGAGAGAGARRTTLPMAGLHSGNSSILQQSDDYTGVRHPLLSSTLQDGGADSDTNSHCALILEETTPPSISTHSGCTASTRPDKSNGNNNYEMREFNRRLLLSNGTAPGNLTAGPRNRRT